MTGVYFPYWVVNAETAGKFDGQKGPLCGSGSSVKIEYTETKVYQIFRKGKAKIRHLTKNALQKNLQAKNGSKEYSLSRFDQAVGLPY